MLMYLLNGLGCVFACGIGIFLSQKAIEYYENKQFRKEIEENKKIYNEWCERNNYPIKF